MAMTPATAPSPALSPGRLSAPELADQLARGAVTVIDVREPMELLGGHIAGSRTVPLARIAREPLPAGPLMRQVQIAAGALVLLGVILSQTIAPAWIALSAFVGAGLVFAGLSGFCGMARLLPLMPWNRVTP